MHVLIIEILMITNITSETTPGIKIDIFIQLEDSILSLYSAHGRAVVK